MQINSETPLLQIKDLRMLFPLKRSIKEVLSGKSRVVHAVDGVSLYIQRGETLSIVGETGSGKSTLARLALGLITPTSGQVFFEGINLQSLSRIELRTIRKKMQIIMQDPLASLNPRRKVGEILELPLIVHKVKGDHKRLIEDALNHVGLNPKEHWNRYPHEFSGGQQQRISIARSIILHPDLLIADEPVSALDVSVRAQILNLLGDLRKEFGLTYMVVAHDLSMVRYLSDRIIVMYLGQFVESGETRKVFNTPSHPYTIALLSAMPRLRVRSVRVGRLVNGETGNPINPPSGCRFSSRCPFVRNRCREESPILRDLESGHAVACHFAEEITTTRNVEGGI